MERVFTMPAYLSGRFSRALTLLLTLPALLILAACGASQEQPEIVGQEAPAFTLPAASGGEVSLSDYEGQPVLLYFHMAGG
jgi:cytochrome oxidase Cu insertion factor (SCO1/SenC/PrrC family)